MIKPMVKTILGAFMITLLASPALALSAKKETTIQAPLNKVWDKIGGWCAIKDWHPAVAACAETRKDNQLRRTLTLEGGGEIVELLTGEDERSYSYIIETSPLPVKNYKATLSVSPQGNDQTKIKWTGTFDADGKPDKEVIDLITGIYEAGLASITKIMK